MLLTGLPATGKTTILSRCLDTAKRSSGDDARNARNEIYAIDARGVQDQDNDSRGVCNSTTTSPTTAATAAAKTATTTSAIGVHFPIEISWLLSREIRSCEEGGERG